MSRGGQKKSPGPKTIGSGENIGRTGLVLFGGTFLQQFLQKLGHLDVAASQAGEAFGPFGRKREIHLPLVVIAQAALDQSLFLGGPNHLRGIRLGEVQLPGNIARRQFGAIAQGTQQGAFVEPEAILLFKPGFKLGDGPVYIAYLAKRFHTLT